MSLYYASFDEDGQPYKHNSQIIVTLQDPSKIKVHTWYPGSQRNIINGPDSKNSFYSSHHTESSSFINKREYFGKVKDTRDDTGSNENGKNSIT